MAGSECRPFDLQDALIYLAGITDGLPVVIYYGRVSTDIQRDDGYSLEMQDSHHRRDAGDRYPDGCHAIFVSDDGLSGTLPYQRGRLKKGRYRPGLTLVKDLVDTGLVSALGVYKCNRLSRKSRIWLELLEDHLDPHGVLFFSSSECVDSSTDAGRMILSILMSEAEFAREQIASGMRDGLHLRRDEGYYLGGEPPYGWRCQDPRFIPDGERVNIEPHPEEAAVVRRVVNLVLGGTRFLTIAKTLTAEGVPTACGLRKWRHATVRRIASCPTHAGLIRNGKGGLVEGRNFPQRIVEPETYYAVLREIERRREADREHDKRDDLLFDGLLTCGICGAKMCVSSPTNLPRLYCCRGRRVGHEHPRFSVRNEAVERKLQDLLRRCVENLQVVNATVEALDAELAQTKQEAHRDKRRLQAKLRQSESDICVWASRMGDPEYNHDVVQEELDWLACDREETLSEIKRLDRGAKREKKQAKTYRTAADLVRSGGRLWESMTFAEKREMASALVQSLACEPTASGAVIHADAIPVGGHELAF